MNHTPLPHVPIDVKPNQPLPMLRQLDSSLYYFELRQLPHPAGTFGGTETNLWKTIHRGYAEGNNDWASPTQVGNSWEFSAVVRGPARSFYAVRMDAYAGDLLWYTHKSGRNWAAPLTVGNGWNIPAHNPTPESFVGIFADQENSSGLQLATGATTIYAVRADGDLLWYRHLHDRNNPNSWAPGSGHRVGNGWVQGFHRVFSGGHGVIYLIADDGTLFWYKHEGYATGAESWAARQEIGSGWDMFDNVYSIGQGCIYAHDKQGRLYLYHHTGFQTGTNAWSARKLVSTKFGGVGTIANSVYLESTWIK